MIERSWVRHERFDDLIEVEARGLLPNRKFLERFEPLRRNRLCGHQQEGTVGHPLVVEDALITPLERIASHVENLGEAQLRKWLAPHIESMRTLFLEHDLPLMYTHRQQLTV